MSFNQLTSAEAERLALLLEEASEVVQACGKILRHGYESHHPDGGPANRAALERELGDVEAAIRIMMAAGDVDENDIGLAANRKLRRVWQWLHHQPRALRDRFLNK